MEESAPHMSEQKPAEPVQERHSVSRALRLAVLVVALVALVTGAGVLLAGRLVGAGSPFPAAFAPQQPASFAGSGALPLEGQPAPINFWASWCEPCRAEMPEIVRAYEAHKADGLVALAINMTFEDSLPEAQAFVKEFHMPFPVLL